MTERRSSSFGPVYFWIGVLTTILYLDAAEKRGYVAPVGEAVIAGIIWPLALAGAAADHYLDNVCSDTPDKCPVPTPLPPERRR